MAPSPGPIHPRTSGAPSRVIQGFFPGGRVKILQASPSPAAVGRPPVPPSMQGRPAPSPAPMRPGRPVIGALRPAAPSRPPASLAILPQAPRPAAVQPHAGNAFALPANFTLKPRGSGQPLPEPIQKKMETFFNASFADVRVHVGPEASSIGALAFTHGIDLYFAPGQYNPQSMQGQQLLGHELTHVVQQRAGRVRNPLGPGVAVVQDPALEAEAERMGLRAATAAVPTQAKPADSGAVVGPLPGKVAGPMAAAANGPILPAGAPAHESVQRKPGPILPAGPAAPGRMGPPPSSLVPTSPRPLGYQANVPGQPGFVARSRPAGHASLPGRSIQRQITVEGVPKGYMFLAVTRYNNTDAAVAALKELDAANLVCANYSELDEAVNQKMAALEAARLAAANEAAALELARANEAAALNAVFENKADKSHTILTIDKIRGFRASGLYRVRAKEEFDETTGTKSKKTRNYGVVFEILRSRDRKIIYTHFHAHHNATYTEVSGHFKNQMSKMAPQSWDYPVDVAAAFTQELQNSGINSADWKVL